MVNQNNITPLAERCRPKTIKEFVGQDHLLAKNKIIESIIGSGKAYSLILWGGPGSGKTTLARLIAHYCLLEAHFLSAISAGVADVRKVIKEGKKNREEGKQTLLFLDEIHRFNKAQQDSVLGSVESGDIILIGATTENPSFSVISPLLSRTRVLKLHPLSQKALNTIIDNALKNDAGLQKQNIHFASGVKERLIEIAGGDARRLLNMLETAVSLSEQGTITDDTLAESVKHSMLYYDKAGDKHYDTISAFIKSLRGSDPNAALYYLARMILSGEDPMFIARRMVIFASEDIGNAAPAALNLAVSTMTAVKNIGLPEAEIILSQCVIFLACAPKSNSAVAAINLAKNIAENHNGEIPLHIRNAPTKLMKEMGYGKEYRYPHCFPGHFVDETYLPEDLKDTIIYQPTMQGSEKSLAERMKTLWPRKYDKK